MVKVGLTLVCLLFCCNLFCNSSYKDGLYTYSSKGQLENSFKNNVSEERLLIRKIEENFHKILNNYRRSIGKSKLKWLDLHWVAAYNHNQWMVENESLTHYQFTQTTRFSGASPSDRIRFVNDLNLSAIYTGENCLYNWVGPISGNTDVKALKIAKKLFNQWKNSPGHYANMTNESHKGHAISVFIEGNGKVWATSLFGNYDDSKASDREVIRNEKVRYFATGIKENTLLIREDKNDASFNKKIKLNTENIEKQLVFELNNSEKSKSGKRYINKAAKKHAQYLSKYNTSGTKQRKGRSLYYGTTTMSRLNKASLLWAWVTGRSKKATEKHATLVFSENIISVEQIYLQLMKQLSNQLEEPYSDYGFGVDVRKRRGGIYEITVVKIVI